MKRLLCLLLAFICCGTIPISADSIGKVSIDITTNNISYNTGELLWTAFPEKADEDEIAQGAFREQLKSILMITYMNENTKLGIANSFNECKGDRTKYAQIADGFELIFDFAESGFKIPIAVKNEEQGFTVSIMAERIETLGTNKLLKISLLPFFGAGGPEETGFVFVPDGSGAIFNFNNGKYYGGEYSADVYGKDLVASEIMRRGANETIKLPVFAIARGNHAMLGIITQGAAVCNITANTAGKFTAHNSVYPTFTYTATDSYTLNERTSGARDVLVAARKPTGAQQLQVRYIFFDQTNTVTYSKLATKYGDYLRRHEGMSPKISNDPPLHLSIYGAVKKKESFLGIPFSRIKPITTYKQVEQIGDSLIEKGVTNLSISYYAWGRGGVDGPISADIQAERVLGGKKGLKELIEWGDRKGVRLNFVCELAQMNSSGNGFRVLANSASTINAGLAKSYVYSNATWLKRNNMATSNLLMPTLYSKAWDRFSKSNRQYNITNIDIGSLSNNLYSDFGSKGCDREEAKILVENLLEQMSPLGIATDAANSYIAKFADEIYNAPTASSGYDTMDQSVPFYQIALSGLVPISGEYVNQSGNESVMLKKATEYGMGLNYQINGVRMDVYENTRLHHLYGGYYLDYIDKIASDYAALKQSLGNTYGKRIVEHTVIDNNTFETQYEDGSIIITSYGQGG